MLLLVRMNIIVENAEYIVIEDAERSISHFLLTAIATSFNLKKGKDLSFW